MKKLVMKFGGTSLNTGKNIKQVISLIKKKIEEDNKVVVVVSALAGVTDQLIYIANQAEKGTEQQIKEFTKNLYEKHFLTINKAIEKEEVKKEILDLTQMAVRELEKVLTGICYVGELTPKSRDYVVSFGERLSAPILWGALIDQNIKAKLFTGKEAGIVTDSNYGQASPLINVTMHQVKERLNPLIEKNIVAVVTGYIAATQEGVVTTIGRGGSDYTATIIGVALNVDEIWIWTDVDGILTTDPKIVKSAKILPELSYQEAAEMAIFGAKAMHPRALEPVMEKNIPVRIRNIFNPENNGTLIKEAKIDKTPGTVKSVALIKDVAMINVNGPAMVGAPGSYAKVLDVLGKNKINIMMISAAVSEANISFVIRRSLVGKALSTLEIALLGRGIISEVSAEDDVAVVAVMGANMKGTFGVASKIFTTVANAGINIRMIAQGSSELNISFIVKEKDGEEVVKTIHKEFDLDNI